MAINFTFRGVVTGSREAGNGNVVEMMVGDESVSFYTQGPVPSEGETILAGGSIKKNRKYVSVMGRWTPAPADAEPINVFVAWGEVTPLRGGLAMVVGDDEIEIELEPESPSPNRGDTCTVFGSVRTDVDSKDKEVLVLCAGMVAQGDGARRGGGKRETKRDDDSGGKRETKRDTKRGGKRETKRDERGDSEEK